MNNPSLRVRWNTLLVEQFSVPERDASRFFDSVIEPFYTNLTENRRYYHNAQHLAHCFGLLDKYKLSIFNFEEKIDYSLVELSIWFHDLVYIPGFLGNEEASFGWANKFLLNFRNRKDTPLLLEYLYTLVLATKKHEVPSEDTKLVKEIQILLDVDLGILGEQEETFSLYEQNIRKEFWFVPTDLYNKERRNVLMSFYVKNKIYYTKFFQENYEKQARLNLRRVLFKNKLPEK